MNTKKAVNESARALELNYNTLYEGVVEQVDLRRRMLLVQIVGARTPIHCTYAGGIFSSMFGLQTKFLPQRGTKVFVLYGSSSYVVGCLPSQPSDVSSGGSKTITGKGSAWGATPLKSTLEDAGADVQNHPMDLLEGELDLTTAFGAGIRLLTSIASLNGGDRARVEACALDDMVRIVDETFQHYSSFGNYEIYNDGRLNVRFDGTSYPHEAYGAKTAHTSDADSKIANHAGFDVDTEELVSETGRWRFSQYLGYLGDFITAVISDPQAAVGDYFDGHVDALKAGKAKVHVNSNGTILAQSVSDIVLERVCRIPIPAEVKRPKDPKGNNILDDFDTLNGDYLKLWDYSGSPTDMAKNSFMLREYARWLSNYHTYARFHQLNKDWYVPTEDESPPPDRACGEEDKRANISAAARTPLNVYATIRIMYDGSIVLLNGTGSSVVMAGYDVHVSSARDLILEASRDIVMTAGNDVHVKARRHVNITAVVGTFLAKAHEKWQALCETGVLWLKSDREAVGDEHSFDNAGVLLDTPASRVVMAGYAGVELRADAGAIDAAGLQVNLAARQELNLWTSGSAKLLAVAGFDVSTPSFKTNANALQLGKVRIRGGAVGADSVTAKTVQGMASVQGPARPAGFATHPGHLDIIGGPILQAGGGGVAVAYNSLSPAFDFDARIWDYPLTTYESAADLCETYAQQYSKLDASAALYEKADLSKERLRAARFTGSGSPWPGAGALAYTHSSDEELREPSAKAYSTIKPHAEGFSKAAYEFRTWK